MDLKPSRLDKKRRGDKPAHSRHCDVRRRLALGLNNRGLALAFADRSLTGASREAEGENRRADDDEELFHDAPQLLLLELTL
jgi:hypothetical protein